MHTLKVKLGNRSYPIHIGTNLLGNPKVLQQHIPGKHVAVITNNTIEKLYREPIERMLAGYACIFVSLSDGEHYKTLGSLELIFDQLLQNHFDRNCTLIAFGGGVVGDIAGFAAATYQRGVHYIQVPTTLLAQVDSSVGGKTAVNHRLGKNMIGAFYQPRCVISDVNCLNTLPKREIVAGIAEVIKYGLISDATFFDWIEQNLDELIKLQSSTLEHAITTSCQIKADIVSADEREHGQRALLNLGHTFGHAIETFVNYKGWLHGEAVAAGMLMAAEFSAELGWLPEASIARIQALLQRAGLSTSPPESMRSTDFLDLMARDKKVIDSTLRLVLLRTIGEARICDDFNQQLLKNYLITKLDK